MVTPPATVRNLQLGRKHCRKVRALGHRIINGETGLIEGTRQMLFYQSGLHARGDIDFEIFRAFDSETRHIPVGEVRRHWSAKALEEQDAKIKRFEDLYGPRILEAASRIRKKYEA